MEARGLMFVASPDLPESSWRKPRLDGLGLGRFRGLEGQDDPVFCRVSLQSFEIACVHWLASFMAGFQSSQSLPPELVSPAPPESSSMLDSLGLRQFCGHEGQDSSASFRVSLQSFESFLYCCVYIGWPPSKQVSELPGSSARALIVSFQDFQCVLGKPRIVSLVTVGCPRWAYSTAFCMPRSRNRAPN